MNPRVIRSPHLMTVLLAAILLSPPVLSEEQQALGLADAAFSAGDLALAKQAYADVLESEPENSRAAYQLARLMPKGSREARRLFGRYVLLEPQDPWGYMALGDALAASGRVKEAIRQYDEAMAIAPAERDVWIGLGKILVRAGRIDRAVRTYEKWIERHSGDALAWRELGNARRRAGRFPEAAEALERSLSIEPHDATERRLRLALAQSAPSITPSARMIRDSDGNSVLRGGLEGDWKVGDRTRMGLSLARVESSDPAVTALSDEFSLTGRWRPRRVFSLSGLAGIARTRGVEPEEETTTTPVLGLRARWRAAGRGPNGEIRLTHAPVTSTPFLLSRPLVLGEVRAIFETPLIHPLRLRALGRIGRLDDDDERNRRVGYGGALVFRLGSAGELSGQYHELSYDMPTTAGYFAPERVQTIEASTYLEYGGGRWPIVLALDAGAGTQRVAEHGQEPSVWGRMYHFWGLMSWGFRPGCRLELEIEGYDSQVAGESLTLGADWRSRSATLSLRWGTGHGRRRHTGRVPG